MIAGYLKESKSVGMRKPAGFRVAYFVCAGVLYKDAIDKDGYVWTVTDDSWRLLVPAFGSGVYDGFAFVYRHGREAQVPVPHNEKTGGITLSDTRTIPQHRWHH